MGFKMKPPYKADPTPLYEVPFDNPDLVAKANKNGTIIVNKDRVHDKKLMDEAMSHEKQHLKDMQEGKLDYDNLSVTFDGKRYSRDSFDEGNENLPWEKRAYAAGREGKKLDLTPKKKKLTGPPKAADDKRPLKFKLKGGSPFTALDENEVNMNENFGPALELDEIADQLDDAVVAHGKQAKGIRKHLKQMEGMNKGTALHSPIKMWGAPAFEQGKDTDPSGGTEEEKIQENKSPYSGSTVGFDVARGQFVQKQRMSDSEDDFESTYINPSDYKGTSTDDSILSTESYKKFKKDNPMQSNVDYDRSFRKGMKNVTEAYDKFKTDYNFYKDALNVKEGEESLSIPYSGGNITFAPDQDFDSLPGDTPLEKMRNIKFTYSNFDDGGNEQPSFGGTKTLAELMDVDGSGTRASGFKNLQDAILDKNTKERRAEFEKTSQELQNLKQNFPDLFTGTNTQKKLRADEEKRLQAQFLEDKKNAPHSNAVKRLEEQYKKDLAALPTKVFDF